MADGDNPDRSRLGWQGDAVDVEIIRARWKHSYRFQWSLYHQARLIKTGVRRSHWAAQLVGVVAAWWYRRSL